MGVSPELIQQERACAEEFMFEVYLDSGLVALSRRNVALAEAMIENNSAYMTERSADNKSAVDLETALGSLCQALRGEIELSAADYSQNVERVVNGIDSVNSTRLNADKVGRTVARDRILGFERKRLVQCLYDPEGTEYELFYSLAEPTKGTEGGRRNPSFASKFCHHVCLRLFEGEKQQDNYPVYDNIASAALRKYVEHFSLDVRVPSRLRGKPFDYPGYRACVDAVIECAQDEISRTGFDRLVWYYFKGRMQLLS